MILDSVNRCNLYWSPCVLKCNWINRLKFSLFSPSIFFFFSNLLTPCPFRSVSLCFLLHLLFVSPRWFHIWSQSPEKKASHTFIQNGCNCIESRREWNGWKPWPGVALFKNPVACERACQFTVVIWNTDPDKLTWWFFCKVNKLTSSSVVAADLLTLANWLLVRFELEPKSGSCMWTP